MSLKTAHSGQSAPGQPAFESPGQVECGLLELTELLQQSRAMRADLASQLDSKTGGESQLLALWHCARWTRDAAHRGGIPQNELVAALALSPAQTSNTLEQLRKQGWLEGYRPSDDRRRQHWRVTAVGEQQLNNWLVRLAPWAERWVAVEQPSTTPSLKLFNEEQQPERTGGEPC